MTKIQVEDNQPVTNLLIHPDGISLFISTIGPDVYEYNLLLGEKIKVMKGFENESITDLK